MAALRAVLIPILAGIAAALGQAPYGLWPVALLGYAAGIDAIARSRRPFWAGLVFGAAHFAVALNWITEPFQVDAAATAWLAIPALVAVALGFGLFWALAGLIGRRVLGGALGVAVALGLVEMVRSYLLTGFPWALPGHVLIASPALPAASLAGAHGFGFAVLLGAGLIALRRPAAAVMGVAVWAIPFAIGALMPPAPPGEGPVVRLVQPNAPQHLKWDPEWIAVFFRRGLEQTAAPGDVALTLWPETALPRLLQNSDDVRGMIANASGAGQVMIGAQRYDEANRPRNTMVLLDGPTGAVTALYDKHRLVPFGEFLPFETFFHAIGIGPLAAQLAGGYAPGEGPRIVDLPGIGAVLPLICYEAIFPQIPRGLSRPRVILHLTNDAWFGTRAGPQQHLALARLRAAEQGLPLLRAANTGVSAAIDARGRVLAQIPLGQAGHLDAPLPAALPPTLYSKVGDALPLLLLAALVTGLLARAPRNPVARPGDRP